MHADLCEEGERGEGEGGSVVRWLSGCGDMFQWVWSLVSVGVVTCTYVHTLISVSGMENDSK